MTQPPASYRPPGSYPPPGPYGPPPGGHGPPPGGWGPPPPYAPPPGPPKTSSAGKIIAVVLIVLVALLALGGFFVYRAVSGVVNSVGGLTRGAGTECSAVSTADVDAALGGDWSVVQLGGLSAIAGPVMDSRVLPDAPLTCWASQDDKDGKLTRIARYQGADAAARFTAEKDKAKGTTVNKGNGLSVSTEGYLGKDVQAGDEAFCTTGDPLSSAGALVRRGDTLIYVSTTAAGDGAAAVPDISVGPDNQVGFATDGANCALAVKLVAAVH